MRRTIHMKVLPGEPLDGGGKVCIHLFVHDERGRFVEPCALHLVDVDRSENGRVGGKQLVSMPTRGRLACDPKRDVAVVTRDGVTTVTSRTDDPRAVTCHKCLASVDYARMMETLTAVLAER